MRRNYVRRVLCLPSRVAHSLVWILPDCHGIVALLVISGKQASSELLHTLRFISVCVGHLSASVQYLRHLHNTEALLVFQAAFSHVSPSRLTSTKQPLATVPGYHTISAILIKRKIKKKMLVYVPGTYISRFVLALEGGVNSIPSSRERLFLRRANPRQDPNSCVHG